MNRNMYFKEKRVFVVFRRWENLLNKSADTITFDGLLIIWIPLIFMLIIGCFFLLEDFYNPVKDTTNVTNIGFAVLAGISSLSFSWAGRLDRQTESQLHDDIVRFGALAFHAALIFITASGLKYIHIHIDNSKPFQRWLGEYVIRYVYMFSFFFAFEKTIFSVTGLNKLLYRKLKIKKK
ncbi:hypothetical protein [Chitinophaga varians]|uniref:hypothetical protein n=1 Tax=Chitinophaga varians TaxID=2202339 RepID=UPI00165ED38F|nr:hypothetical protein [Chitinophaga varians]MBC9910573.1 hypothetical protein [Chitinophaga varians]